MRTPSLLKDFKIICRATFPSLGKFVTNFAGLLAVFMFLWEVSKSQVNLIPSAEAGPLNYFRMVEGKRQDLDMASELTRFSEITMADAFAERFPNSEYISEENKKLAKSNKEKFLNDLKNYQVEIPIKITLVNNGQATSTKSVSVALCFNNDEKTGIAKRLKKELVVHLEAGKTTPVTPESLTIPLVSPLFIGEFVQWLSNQSSNPNDDGMYEYAVTGLKKDEPKETIDVIKAIKEKKAPFILFVRVDGNQGESVLGNFELFPNSAPIAQRIGETFTKLEVVADLNQSLEKTAQIIRWSLLLCVYLSVAFTFDHFRRSVVHIVSYILLLYLTFVGLRIGVLIETLITGQAPWSDIKTAILTLGRVDLWFDEVSTNGIVIALALLYLSICGWSRKNLPAFLYATYLGFITSDAIERYFFFPDAPPNTFLVSMFWDYFGAIFLVLFAERIFWFIVATLQRLKHWVPFTAKG